MKQHLVHCLSDEAALATHLRHEAALATHLGREAALATQLNREAALTIQISVHLWWRSWLHVIDNNCDNIAHATCHSKQCNRTVLLWSVMDITVVLPDEAASGKAVAWWLAAPCTTTRSLSHSSGWHNRRRPWRDADCSLTGSFVARRWVQPRTCRRTACVGRSSAPSVNK